MIFYCILPAGHKHTPSFLSIYSHNNKGICWNILHQPVQHHHTPLPPKYLHQHYWLTPRYWQFPPPRSSLHNLCIVATGFLLDCWPLQMRPIGCPETSVRNCHYSLRNTLEERSSDIFRMYNIYCISTATMDMRKRPYIMLYVDWLSCWKIRPSLMGLNSSKTGFGNCDLG